MKDKNRAANQVLADMMFFDYLKEKVGERKTKTGAYYDLLEKATAGFIAPFLKNHEYVLQAAPVSCDHFRPCGGMALAQGYRQGVP